jgi:beta-lactamase class C
MLLKILLPTLVFAMAANSHAAAAAADKASNIDLVVDRAIKPLMQQYGIQGMAIGITINGRAYFHEYGVANRETRQPITSDTLFEIGSISKTFTATLASYAQVTGKLSWQDSASAHIPTLSSHASAFGNISLLNLATHTSGGLPLQVPNDIRNNNQLIEYFKYWRPRYAPGAERTYSNLGIGLLGMASAASMQMSFDDAMEKILLPELGMRNSYLRVPASQVRYYAQGYTSSGEPTRLNAGMLAAPTYGIRSSAQDMLRYLDANLQASGGRSELERALLTTHTGYFQAGAMTQALAWERYPYPVELTQLLAGNTDAMASQTTPTTRIDPPLAALDAWINKTGSTNGFAAYVAFVPSRKIGIVLLANKNYPVAARIVAAHQIVSALDQQRGQTK